MGWTRSARFVSLLERDELAVDDVITIRSDIEYIDANDKAR